MRKIFLVVIFCLLSQFSSLANDRDIRLEQLFNELKVNKSKQAYEIEQEIWAIWSSHPTDQKLTARLEEGSQFVRDQKYIKAKNVFSEVIKLDQNWAEAWNKRATVLYLLGNFEASQKDIDKVLELESRHFGALAGQGLVNIQLKNYEKAIKSYEKVLKIYPSMESSGYMIQEIEKMIKKDSI
tara:strand:+ start:65 stop:613 length:549 start_codon:yes stop_codon:yes gene_type:complete